MFLFYSLENSTVYWYTGPLVHYTNYHIKGQICEGVTKIRQSDTTDFTVCPSALVHSLGTAGGNIHFIV